MPKASEECDYCNYRKLLVRLIKSSIIWTKKHFSRLKENDLSLDEAEDYSRF